MPMIQNRRYRLLLRKTMPVVIKTEAEYRRTMATIKHLMDKDEYELTDEEGRILELLAMLAEEYEDRKHPPAKRGTLQDVGAPVE